MNPSAPVPRLIRPAVSDEDLARCFPVMAELRPHLAAADFVSRVREQERDGYRMAFVESDGTVQSVAGFRVLLNLAWGRFLYVDDLVTRRDAQGQGHGGALFDWLVEWALAEGCAEFHLDSGLMRFDAHRFYQAHRMDITAYHFALKLR